VPLAAQTIDPQQQAPQGLMRWFNPSTAPFIPVPLIDVDPNSGTTFGLIPTWISTDEQSQVRRIVAPDIIHNPNFGFGARGRILAYPSEDTQWSVVGGAKQHVEKEFDFEYEAGRLRNKPFSFTASAVYDRSGTARFYGFGNRSRKARQTNYTLEQGYVQTALGWNISRVLQLSYAYRARAVEVERGSLANIPSIETLFPRLNALGTRHESLNRLALVVDTRDDATVPTEGGKYVLYGGVAAAQGVLGNSLYSVAGLDLRQLWRINPSGILVGHLSLRYMPKQHGAPFWSLSNLGGDDSVLGEALPLRGFGTGRFYDRDAVSSSLEYRWRVFGINAVGTYINLEVTPFVDAGEVFAHSQTLPFRHLHKVAGVGFRGVASPFVVGYVDLGYGSEGVAAFTGINYPF
jgi:outer membrane protein assembly factor BamA